MMAATTSIKQWVYDQLDPEARENHGLSATNKILIVLIVLASAFAIAETEPTLFYGRAHLFRIAELVAGVVFSVEYVARLWVAPMHSTFRGKTWPRLRYMVSAPAIIDFLAVVPTFFTLGPAGGSVLLRFFRVLRIMRLAKLGRMTHAWHDLAAAVHERRHELLLTISLALFVLLIASTLMYWAESDAQPDKFGSIPRAMWWCIVTLTTVGYGDVFPVTVLGKMFAGLVALAGIGLIAMPTGILASAFSDVVQRRRDAAEEAAETRAREERRKKRKGT